MRHRFLALTTLGSFVSFACSCSSSYVPVASPRASLVMDSGTYAYVKDGKKYEGGYFGGDLEQVVQGNAKAEEYAHAYKTGVATGFALTVLGAAAGIGGLVLFGAQAEQSQSGQSIPPTGLVIAGGGLIVELIGSIVVANAQPHLTDAINAYNDGLLSPSNGSATSGPPNDARAPARSSGEVPRQTASPSP